MRALKVSHDFTYAINYSWYLDCCALYVGGSLYAQPAEECISAYADAINSPPFQIAVHGAYLTFWCQRPEGDCSGISGLDNRLNHRRKRFGGRGNYAVSPRESIRVAVLNQDVSARHETNLSTEQLRHWRTARP